MTRLLGVLCLSLWASSVAAQGLKPGTVIGVVDGPRVDLETGGVEISGWAFHTGGAAILRVRLWLDCNPFAGSSCGSQQFGMASEAYYRPDVVSAFPQFSVPMVAGWELVASASRWNLVTDGPHWLYGGANDAEHGMLLWTQLNPRCFKKAGTQILPC